MLHATESQNNLCLIVRKNFVDLRDSTMKDFRDYTGLSINEDKKEAFVPQTKSTVMFRHGDELPVLKNLNLGCYGIEQAEEFGDSTAWDMLLQRLRRDVKFRTGFLIANANGHNWIYNKWVKNGAPKNHLLIEATTYDFKDILPADYIENLEANLPAKMFRRYVLNSHEEAEGLVFDEFLESSHVVEPFDIPDSWERGFVLDHGFRNPTAVLYYAIDHDGNVIIYDEHYEREKPVSHHAECIKGKMARPTGYADPSIFSKTQSKGNYIFSIADEYQEHGVTLIPALREEENAAISRVNEFFKAGRIKVFRTCSNFIHEISNWKWEAPKAGNTLNLKERPQDKDNHLMDGLKYLIQSRFSAPIKKEPEAPRNSAAHYINHLLNPESQPKGFTYKGPRFHA